MAEVVERLPVPLLKLGEGPHWLAKEDSLLFVDVFDKALRKYDITTRKENVLYLDNPEAERASMVIPVEGEDNLYLVGLGKTVSVVRWPGEGTDVRSIKPTIIHKTEDPHLNDAKCDPKGRLWFGTMTYLDEKEVPAGHEDSALYRYDQDLQVTKWVDKVTISNGMAWSNDRQLFYYVDSGAGRIYVFDYDDEKGTIANRRVLLDYQGAGLANQSPDGLTIDADNNLWVACFGGAQVICVNTTTQQVVRKVALPSPNITSACFGGPQMSTLFVTSGTLRLSNEEKAAYPQAGGTFAINGLGVKGYPPIEFKCNLGKLRGLMSE